MRLSAARLHYARQSPGGWGQTRIQITLREEDYITIRRAIAPPLISKDESLRLAEQRPLLLPDAT
jgi:hypothetical protein